jgi:hypothetical protein
MSRLLLLLTLGWALGGPPLQWAAGLFGVAAASSDTDAGGIFDPDGRPGANAGNQFDPNGGDETDAGNIFDPNG